MYEVDNEVFYFCVAAFEARSELLLVISAAAAVRHEGGQG